MKKYLTHGPLLIVIAAVLWGLDGVLRRSLFSLPPITIVFFEHVIGALLLAPFFFRSFLRERLRGSEWGAIIVVSLLSGVLGTLFFTTALQKVNFISFSVVFLLQKLQPIFAVSAAAIVLKERITPHYLGYAILAIGAAYFVTFPGGVVSVEAGTGTVVAALFAVGAAFMWGTSTAFSRFVLLGHSHTFVTGMRFFLTIPFAFAILLLTGKFATLAEPTSLQFGKLLLIALSTGMVALWIYYRGLKRTEAKVSTILELVFPLTAVFIDFFLYDTALSWMQYVAGAVLFFAVYRVSKLNKETSSLGRFVSSVVSGKGRGKGIGFPTLNLEIPDRIHTPYGIYAGHLYLEGRKHKASIHFGPVPTFNEETPVLEVFLLDGVLEDVPEKVEIEFVSRIRDIKIFANSDELSAQIAMDVKETKNTLTF